MAAVIEEQGGAGDVSTTLDAVDRLWGVKLDAEAEMFELAAHFADLQGDERLTCGGRVLAGMERAVRLGGSGTPLVAEFACVELGARMRMGSVGARHYVADALDVRHRLPQIWVRVRRREARVAFARLVAARTRHLSVESAAEVDAAMAVFVDGSLPWGRFEARLEGRIVAADPEAAAAREAVRVSEQLARRSRSSEHGIAGFYVRSTVGVIARLDATVAHLAELLALFGDTEVLELRRVKAIALLANPARAVELLAAGAALRSRTVDVELPWDVPPDSDVPDDRVETVTTPLERMDVFARRVGFHPTRLPAGMFVDPGGGTGFSFDWGALLPPLTLHVHLSEESLRRGRGVARWEGEGPVTTQFVHDHLRPLHRYVIAPVLDLAGQAPVDAYEIPDRQRRAVQLRTPADSFPFSSRVSRDLDLDHVEPWRAQSGGGPGQSGPTRTDNLTPLGRFHHRLKTHGRWTVRQPFDGILVWRDPHGQIYLVDHTGTHKVTPAGHRAGAAR